MKIAVVVPAYNEEKSIEAVVSGIHFVAKQNQLDINVVIINDCSRIRINIFISYKY